MPRSYPNALYALLQVDSSATSEDAARTTLALNPSLRHGGGLHIAALGLAAEHGSAQFAFTRVGAVPIAMSLHQRDIGPELQSLDVLTRMLHQGRSVMVTSIDVYPSGNTSRRVAFGSITWSVLPPFPPRDPDAAGIEHADGTLPVIAGVTTGADGMRSIEAIPPDVAGPGGVLHAGALQILAEEVALSTPVGDVWGLPLVVDAAFQFIRAAKDGPFTARRTVLSPLASAGGDIEVKIVDRRDRVCAVATCRVIFPGHAGR